MLKSTNIIIGNKGSGKDTIGNYLINKYNFKKLLFNSKKI